MRKIVPDYIPKLTPYTPGKPIEEVERELGIKVKAKLASNENPFGPSPKAMEAIKAFLPKSNLYPDSGCFYLKQKIAEKIGISMDQVILANGTTELIELVARTFLAENENAVIAEQTFIMYPIVLRAKNAQYSTIPLKNYRYDLKAMAQAVNEMTKLVYIANPNNPTGTMVTKEEVDEFLNSISPDIVVVMDEAYYDYIDRPDYPDSLRYMREGKKVIILRSFSKSHGLAGIRIGYGIGDEELISYIDRMKLPFNVNALSQEAALAAIDDIEHINTSKKKNAEGMKYLMSELENMGIEYVDSVTNFMLIIIDKDSDMISQKLLHEGVIVRSMKRWGLPTALRVTIGTREEIEIFLEAFKKVLAL